MHIAGFWIFQAHFEGTFHKVPASKGIYKKRNFIAGMIEPMETHRLDVQASEHLTPCTLLASRYSRPTCQQQRKTIKRVTLSQE